MRDIELYRHLLGLQPPWTVTRVELALSEQRIDVWVGHAEGVRFPCPTCGGQFPLYDHSEARVWRHLDSCQFLTYVHARIPRVWCPDHGVHQVEVPWALPYSRCTTLFECMAIGVLQETDILGAARILRISWDEAWKLMERAVERGLRRKPTKAVPHLGVDEKSIAKGQTYLTLVNDLDRGTVEYIGDGRHKSSLDKYYHSLSPKQREGIQAVAMDMWEPYLLSTRQYVPEADSKIVFDRYHVMSHMGDAVDTVRKQEQRALRAAGLGLEDGASLGPQRAVARLVGLPASRLGGAFVEALVFPGHALAAGAGGRGGAHAAPAPAELADVFQPPHHQCRQRRPQLEDPGHQATRLWVSEPRPLQDRHLVPLWWPRSFPVYPLNSRMDLLLFRRRS